MDSEFDEGFSLLAVASMVGVEVASFDIPLDKVNRFVWVALDCYIQQSATGWACEGELRFTKFGSPVLTIPLRRGNSPFTVAGAPTATTQGPGGVQPSLVIGDPLGTGVQTSVEIPCWQMTVQAERVALYIKSISDSAGTSLFVAGLRIQSQ